MRSGYLEAIVTSQQLGKAISPRVPPPRNGPPVARSAPYWLLGLGTILCLLPFSGRAFHTDDTLFIWAAQHILEHPFDPYGFTLNWEFAPARMAEITQNPPLAAYYMALWAKFVGWSERAMHLVFLLPAIALVLGAFRLAQRFTGSSLLAAFATLFAPALLVSACSTMCDPMMLAFWLWAAIFWIEGLDSERPVLLVASSFLITASELTKYFGAALIPLLLAYSLARKRRVGMWACYLLIPVAVLTGYEFWTAKVYGHGLLATAADFSLKRRVSTHASKGARALVGLSYLGGCVLPGLFLAPLIWSRKQIAVTLIASGAAGFLIMRGLVRLGVGTGSAAAVAARHEHWGTISAQLVLFIAGGISCLALAISDYRRERDAESLFLLLWVGGSFWFAAFLNWTINARSILVTVPALGILLARRLELRAKTMRLKISLAMALLLSAAVSLWIAAGDTEAANSAQAAAQLIEHRTKDGGNVVWFLGHSGFQYYMQSFGARPYDWWHPQVASGDLLAFPYAKVWPSDLAKEFPGPREDFSFAMRRHASTNCPELGAGFYYSYWSVLPYVFGPIPDDKYAIAHLEK